MAHFLPVTIVSASRPSNPWALTMGGKWLHPVTHEISEWYNVSNMGEFLNWCQQNIFSDLLSRLVCTLLWKIARVPIDDASQRSIMEPSAKAFLRPHGLPCRIEVNNFYPTWRLTWRSIRRIFDTVKSSTWHSSWMSGWWFYSIKNSFKLSSTWLFLLD